MNTPTPAASSAPPKFQGGSNPIIGPTSPAEWADFYRWLFSQWQQVQTLVSEQSVNLSAFPPAPGQTDTGGEAIGLSAGIEAALSSFRGQLAGIVPNAIQNFQSQKVSPPPPIFDFPRYYVLPTIGPVIIDLVANLGLYPASAFAHWLFLDSATLLFQYSDGTNWNPIPINTATPGTFTLADVTVDSNHRISVVAAGTGAQIETALGFTPATEGANATVSFSLTADLVTGAVTGSITVTQV